MRVVITGGPCSGKTTLLSELESRGFASVPEAAILVIQELNEELGVEGQKLWRRSHLREFQTRVLETQIDLETRAKVEHGADGRIVFFDRGRLDGLAYCEYFEQKPPSSLLRANTEHRYDSVFVLDTLGSFSGRESQGRTSDRSTSIALGSALERTYRAHGYSPTRIEEASVSHRADRLLSVLGVR